MKIELMSILKTVVLVYVTLVILRQMTMLDS